MADNKNLQKAKKEKNDEFYTLMEDIQNELNHPEYQQVFKGKTIYCNCDDPEESNFWKYFKLRFKDLELKELISTHYEKNPEKSSYCLRYDGTNIRREELVGNGDFRDKECIELLKQSDIVCSNPPFSLYVEYITQLIEYKKTFIIWGNNNAISNKDIFPLINRKELFLGYMTNKTCYFQIPDYYEFYDKKYTEKKNDGHKYAHVQSISIFTNIENSKRNIPLSLEAKFSPEKYYKYINFDAWNIDEVKEIPKDDYFEIEASEKEYKSLKDTYQQDCELISQEKDLYKVKIYRPMLAVPISFMSKFSSSQFEIIGSSGQLAKKISTILEKGTYQQGGPSFYSNKITSKDIKRGFKFHRHYSRIVIRKIKENNNEN